MKKILFSFLLAAFSTTSALANPELYGGAPNTKEKAPNLIVVKVPRADKGKPVAQQKAVVIPMQLDEMPRNGEGTMDTARLVPMADEIESRSQALDINLIPPSVMNTFAKAAQVGPNGRHNFQNFLNFPLNWGFTINFGNHAPYANLWLGSGLYGYGYNPYYYPGYYGVYGSYGVRPFYYLPYNRYYNNYDYYYHYWW